MKNVNKNLIRISSDESLISASLWNGRVSVPVYDNGFGSLWVSRDSSGVLGVCRADGFQDAYSTCEDEFFHAADEDAAKDHSEIESDHDQNCWDEAYGHRGNGRRESDGSMSYIYSRDLNGDSLVPLTRELAEEIGLSVQIEAESSD